MDRIWSKTLRPGEKWSGNIGRGRYIHFKALGDDANVSLLMYNMYDTSERYNMPDTLKAQFISALTHGNVMMSDNDRVMASIVQDTTGWNDTISGLVDRRRTGADESEQGGQEEEHECHQQAGQSRYWTTYRTPQFYWRTRFALRHRHER